MLPELSTVLYYAMQSKAITSPKSGNFIHNLHPLIVSRSLPNVYQMFLDPLFATFYKNIRVLTLKNMIFRPYKKPFQPNFDRKLVFNGLKKPFLSDKTRVGHLFFSKKRSDLCVLFRSL